MLYVLNSRHEGDHDDYGGLHRDLSATGSAIGRRQALRRLGLGTGALALFGCGDAASNAITGTDTTIDTGTSGSTTGATTCSKIPSETAGP